MLAPLPLSVVIITFNEARRIADCIASVRQLADDIVVVDSHSRDGTAEIAAAAGARVVAHDWPGYARQKNHGNALARHDWILSLDADERVSPELAASLRAEFERGPARDAYEIRFHNYVGEARVRFGSWNPEFHVRLFDRRKFQWRADEVHEGLQAAGPCSLGRLGGWICHRTVETPAELAAKTERYSNLFAEKLRRQHRRPGWAQIWLNPPFRLMRDYVFRLGVLDGHIGWVIAWEAARYTYFKYRRALPAESAGGGWSALMAAGAAGVAIVVLYGLGAPRPHPAPEANETASLIQRFNSSAPANDDFDNNPPVLAAAVVDDEVLL
jgi:glycosyltransferase involved in cell wall biosynthesis